MMEYQPSFLVLSTPHFNGEGLGYIPGSGTKISQALQQKKKKKKTNQLGGLPKIMYLKNGKASI